MRIRQLHACSVPTYDGRQDEVVYLVTNTATVVEHALPFVFTDRNAALAIARYSDDLDEIESLIDWPLMEGQWFNNTPAKPDRLERRMAELLVHHHVPWSAILGVTARTDTLVRQASDVLVSVGVDPLPVRTQPDWYF